MDKQFKPTPAPSRQEEALPADLQAVVDTYLGQPVPRPSANATTHLLQRLLVEAEYVRQQEQIQQPQRLWQTLALARWRLYLSGSWLWITAVLFFLLLIGLSYRFFTVLPAGTPPSSSSIHTLTLWLILLLPLNAVLSLAYMLRTHSAGLRQIEASCPVNFVQTALGMGMAVLAFDILLGLIATVFLALAHFAPFWNLLLAWLAPLLLLSVLSLPLALLCGVRLAALVGGLPWLLLGLGTLVEQSAGDGTGWLFTLPQDTFALSTHLAVIALSLVLIIMLFFSAPKWQRFCSF